MYVDDEQSHRVVEYYNEDFGRSGGTNFAGVISNILSDEFIRQKERETY